MRPLQPLVAIVGILIVGTTTLAASAAASSPSELECDTECGVNRVRICHHNGQAFQSLCIRLNSALRGPKNHHASSLDYCGPCTGALHMYKAFETASELQQAVLQYAGQEFFDARLAERYGWPMNQWNVSLVEDFSDLFANKPSLFKSKSSSSATTNTEESLSEWEMSRATDLSRMFLHCSQFTGASITNWDVSNVRSLERTFFGASQFNGDLSRWQTSSVTSMMGTFWRASAFNQPVASWDLLSVVDTSRMFAEAHAFDQDVSSWNMESVQNLSSMFMQATSFSQDLSAWQISPTLRTMERILYKVPSYERSTSKQGALLDSWKSQMLIGNEDHFSNINTQDIFSLPPSPLEEKQQEVATSFMRRGKKAQRQHVNTNRVHLSTGGQHHDHNDEPPAIATRSTMTSGSEERNEKVDVPVRPQRYPYKCDTGFCQYV